MKNLLVIAILFLVIKGYSCECVIGIKMEEHIEMADFIFYGKVEEILDSKIADFKNTMHYWLDSTYIKYGGYVPKLKVLKIYKGAGHKTFNDRRIIIDQDFSNCDFLFKRNKKYIIFGHLNNDGKISTSVCVPTSAIKRKKELNFIKRLTGN